MKATQNQKWFRIYTDGFKIGMEGYVGAEVYCQEFSYYIPIGAEETDFEGDIKSYQSSTIKYHCKDL